MDNLHLMEDMLNKAREAQAILETYSQEKVDACVKAIAKAIYDEAESLAKMAVDETGYGTVENKLRKNTGKATAIWYDLKGVKSRGILRYIEDEGIVEIAKPMGVVGSITPSTNPTVTPMHNAMIAIKCGNAVIVSPHPMAKKVTKVTINLMRDALEKLGAPADLIQFIEEPKLELTKLVMEMCDIIVATGGPEMVKSAYSSGTPAYGGGPGNVQCLIDRDADLDEAVPGIVFGRTYDFGVPCTCEQSIICPRELYDDIVTRFKNEGAHYIDDPEEIARLREVLFPDGNRISRTVVGQDPKIVAKMANIDVPENTKLLLVKLEKCGKEELLSREKLLPILGAYAYDKWEDAVEIAKANLKYEGEGHSIEVRSFNKEHIEYAALNINVCRVAVNQVSSNSLGGTMTNGLAPTLTLGCGTWGKNSISEGVSWKHMMNTTRISYLLDKTPPTDEEIWAD